VIRLLVSTIDPKKLEAARAIATKEADGFLLFQNHSREYQLLFARHPMPEVDGVEEERRRLKAGGCCGSPSVDDGS
jgi:hypothetical protein